MDCMDCIEMIKSKGFTETKSESGHNEFRSWTIHYFSHPKGLTLIFDDSRLLVIVRREGRVIHEGRADLNFINKTF